MSTKVLPEDRVSEIKWLLWCGMSWVYILDALGMSREALRQWLRKNGHTELLESLKATEP